jgi:TonB-dependent receptor
MADSMSVQTADKSLPTFFSATDITDAAAYELDAVEVEDNLTNERTVEGALDLTLPLSLGEKILELKGGLKGRQREKMRDNSYQEYSRSQDMVLSEVAGDFANPDFLGGEYPNSAKNFQDPQKIKDDFDRGGYEATPAEDLLEDNWLGDYEVTEEIAAGYLQAKLGVEKLSLLGGVRIEYTMADYLGYRIESQVSSFKGSSSTTEVMPMVHLRFSPLDNLNLRAAYTKTFARPDFYDLVPFYLRDENSIELGNPDLTNTHAHNIDILGEYFFESLGLASAGFFVKSITDFIYNGAYSVDSLEFSQKINGDAGLLYGAELSIEKQLSFLPGALSGLGIGGNYTLAQSEAEVTPVAGTAKRTITLPGQSEQVLNAYVHYEKFGLSARVALNYHSPFLDEVGESAQQDVYYNEHLQLDASISYTVGESGLVVFADAVNLTNEPLRYFMEYNDERYPRQQEFYSWWANIGIKYSF